VKKNISCTFFLVLSAAVWWLKGERGMVSGAISLLVIRETGSLMARREMVSKGWFVRHSTT
jgi:hypothetical protein